MSARLVERVIAGQLTLTLVRVIGDEQAIGRLSSPSNALVQEVRVILRPLAGREQATLALYRSRSRWSEQELTERGLPLYWSKEWLCTQLRRYHSYAEIEDLSGYPAATLKLWRVRHKIATDYRKQVIRKAWASGAYKTRGALAAEYRISLPTLRRLLK